MGNQRGSPGVEAGVNMRSTDEQRSDAGGAVDWPGLLRLAVVAGLAAAAAAIALHGIVSETTLVVTVIVLATMASWFQIEHPRPAADRLPVRRHPPHAG